MDLQIIKFAKVNDKWIRDEEGSLSICGEIISEIDENEIEFLDKLSSNLNEPMNDNIRFLINIHWEKFLLKFKENSFLKISKGNNVLNYVIYSHYFENSWNEIINDFENTVKKLFINKINYDTDKVINEINKLTKMLDFPKEQINFIFNMQNIDIGINELTNSFTVVNKIISYHTRYDLNKYLNYGILCRSILFFKLNEIMNEKNNQQKIYKYGYTKL